MATINTGGSGIGGEDQISSSNMAIFQDLGDWHTMAHENPSSTTKGCRKRWLHSLSPDSTQSTWTPEEDCLLLDLYKQFGTKWNTIARHIAGRTGDACSERYREALDPNLTKNDWLAEEDDKLEGNDDLQGDKWNLVEQDLHQNGLAGKTRWNLLELRRTSRTLQSDLLEAQFTKAEPNTSNASGSSPISSIESAQIQDDTIVEADWPPYYPPEAYPTFPSDEDPQVLHSFREPTPEIIISVSPCVAPFQFSSSSLSAALSDPPKLPKPLPPLTGQAFSPLDLEPQPSLSPLPIQNSIPDVNFGEPALDIFFGTDQPSGDFPSLPYRHLLSGLDTAKYDQTTFNSISPISLPTDVSVQSDNGDWQSPGLSEMFFSLFEPSSSQSSTGYDAQEEFSSASSTPFAFSSSLSPTSSPGMVSPLELPPNEASTSGSLLFSQSHSNYPNSGRARKLTPKRISKLLKQTPTRLSSLLPITSDGSVRPYACGRESCWPPGNPTSSHCFATSRELFEHSKEQHPTGLPGDKPYKCALAGCGKSWKSLNGLQYHLQISTAHFKNAVTSRFSLAQRSNFNDDQAISGALTETEDEDHDRVWQCLKPNCFKAYRHSSGLRYHVKHGHPEHLPAQLSEVPPTLARQLPAKTRTMKRKHPSDFED